MANPTFAVPMGTTKWGEDGIQIAPDTTATTYYPGEMIARISATGLATHCDNTSGIAFWGINAEAGDFVVTSAGPSRSYMQVHRPWRFTAKIAAAVAGDEGRALYARYSDEVSYSQTNSVLVGWVDEVISATLVRVNPIYGPLTNLSVASNTLTFTGATGANTVVMPDNIADALSVKEGSNSYLTFKTTDSAEEILLKKETSIADTFGLTIGASVTGVVTLSNGDGTTALVPKTQVIGTAKGDSSLLLAAFSATATTVACPSLDFLKSANATAGSNTVVASGEILGEINWFGADGTDFKSCAARIQAAVDTTPGTGDMPGRLVFSTSVDAGETLTEALRITNGQAVLCTSPTGGLGYRTGAGGAVTQITNRSTGVTLSKVTGTITTDTTSLAAGAEAEFTVTNTTVAATDTVIVSLASGSSGVGTCVPYVSAVAAGSFKITISNQHASTAETGACVLNFAVIKGVAA